jgi:hypothetical protein
MDSEQVEVKKPMNVITIEVKLKIMVLAEDYEDASDKIDAGQGTVVDRTREMLAIYEVPQP